METIASAPPGRIPEPMSVHNFGNNSTVVHDNMPNDEAEELGNTSSSPPLDDQMERLKQYEKDLKKRRELDEQRVREQAFLRASLRGSKKLQSLENTNHSKKLEIANGKVLNEETMDMGYSNKCYVTSDVSYRENLDKCHDEPIPLEQVIISVNRVADHLEQSEGREEESRIIREYFTQEPIQKAIEAAAVHRSSQGATVRNEGEKVIVGRVVKGGVAERSHLLREGDELIEANGHDLRGRSVTEVCDILRSISGELSLVVVPSSKPESEKATDQTNTTLVQHMRALFDYDPEDDFYVPCKELALKFQRGDILHVINTSDESWWQAYREGDDPSSSLAGLIPSTTFQQQVILYNRELERENGSDGGKRKDFFGCAKKKSFGKPKGRRISEELKSADEIADDDEMLTYEEVSLYLSKTSRKRPIVLCGPEGVGCLELRQRLAESDKEKFASAIPRELFTCDILVSLFKLFLRNFFFEFVHYSKCSFRLSYLCWLQKLLLKLLMTISLFWDSHRLSLSYYAQFVFKMFFIAQEIFLKVFKSSIGNEKP
ncbi:unnamed protein product [Toxocara canis]|uniref:MAGUK p55 subfamily member 5 n=1 Tax=Toxocara canis TaxID=6265 RepID=A0A183VAB9_TOXCA|nr:unnamed protein product [Toxocara canis]